MVLKNLPILNIVILLPRIRNKKISKQKMCKNPLHKLLFFYLLIFGYFSSNAQSISINTTSYTPEQLVKDIFIGNNQSCIAVDNIRVSGKEFSNGDKSWGYFNKATSNFAINEGIILSTGRASAAAGPNSYLQSEGDSNWSSDPDLFEMLTSAD
ncbi:MAG: choice-of-anchor L domain-containing protein, partial [Soonwooa sp.]